MDGEPETRKKRIGLYPSLFRVSFSSLYVTGEEEEEEESVTQ